jgi:hypothetical protein
LSHARPIPAEVAGIDIAVGPNNGIVIDRDGDALNIEGLDDSVDSTGMAVEVSDDGDVVQRKAASMVIAAH